MTANEFLETKCAASALPPDFDHLDMSLLCFLAGKHALSAAWAKQPCAVVGVTDRYWNSLITLAKQRVVDGQVNAETPRDYVSYARYATRYDPARHELRFRSAPLLSRDERLVVAGVILGTVAGMIFILISQAIGAAS